MAVCFCTLAVHAPYRQRARLLCGDIPSADWVVLTDQPADFSDLPVRAVRQVRVGFVRLRQLRGLLRKYGYDDAAIYREYPFLIKDVFFTAVDEPAFTTLDEPARDEPNA